MTLRRFALALALLICAADLRAQEVGGYPTAQVPLLGNERLLADQNGQTVDITPAQLGAYLFPGGASVTPVAGGGTGVATLSGILKGNGTSPVTSAIAADVYNLWTSPSSSCYLRGDGVCVTPAGTGTVTTTSTPTTGAVAAFSGATSITNATSAQILAAIATVPIANGGTGQPTAAAAINALLPSQTGQSGNCLSTNGTSSLWAGCGSGGGGSGGSTQFATVTSNTTLSSGSTSVLVNASGGNVAITLPSAVGQNNNFYIKRIDASTNTVTIGTTSAQTIDGQSSVGIQFQYSSVTLKSDNANWWIT